MMKIRELTSKKDMMMVFDANKKVRNAVEYLVYESEQQNIDSFLDEFEDVFEYSDYSFENESITVNRTGSIEDLESAICDLDDYDYLPPEFNLHKLLELSNMYICTDDDIKADEILGEILDEFEEGFKRFCQRVKSRDYLLYSLEKFISCDFESFGYILDKEIDDNFYIIEEEPQTPMMRKYLDASKEDRDKIWEHNPKFREEVRKEVIADKQDFINDTMFSLIEGAITYIDIEKNVCLVEIFNDKVFVNSLSNIVGLDIHSEAEDVVNKVKNEDYKPTKEDMAKIIGSLKMTVEIAHQSTQNMNEIREYHEDIILDTLEEDSLVYDDNFILYKSFS